MRKVAPASNNPNLMTVERVDSARTELQPLMHLGRKSSYLTQMIMRKKNRLQIDFKLEESGQTTRDMMRIRSMRPLRKNETTT